MINRKIIALILIVILVLGIIFFIRPAQEVSTGKPIVKVGVIVPLTKELGFLGESIQNALVLAKEKLPTNTKYDYQFFFEDDQFNSSLTPTAAQKLINVDNVDAIITFGSNTGNVVSPMTQDHNIVHLGIASDVMVAKGEYNFIHWTQPEEESRVFVEELKKRNIHKFAFIGLNNQGGKVIIDAIKKDIINTDINLVSEEYHTLTETDFKTYIIKAQENNPEIYLLLTGSPKLEILTKQIKELGVTAPLTSIEMFEFTDQPELFEGTWYVQAAEPTASFQKDFNLKFGKLPEQGSANAYDWFNLLVKAYEDSNSPVNQKPSTLSIAKTINNTTNFTGALGALNVDANGIVRSNAIVKQVKNGKFVLLDD